jgi:hypothetical protein
MRATTTAAAESRQEQHGLRSGIAPYWEANSVTLDSGGTITMGSVQLTGRGLSPWHWNEDMRLFRRPTTAPTSSSPSLENR